MNSKGKKLITIVILAAGIILCMPKTAQAGELFSVKATAYCYNSGATATGTIPVEGRTLAGKREWFGKTAYIWEDKGNGIESQNFIGRFKVEDTGGAPIRNGYVVDVFITDYDRAMQFGCKKVYIWLVDEEG